MIPPGRKRFRGPADDNSFTAATGEVPEVGSDPPSPERDWKNGGQAKTADCGNNLPGLRSVPPDEFCDNGNQRESGQWRVTHFRQITRSGGQSCGRCEKD